MVKIAVYTITKNEEKNVHAFMSWAKHADIVVIGDTGSSDNTIQLFNEYPNVKLSKININPWRFDQARNEVLDLVPEDIDICVSADLDEVMEPIYSWRSLLEKYWKNCNRVSYPYQYSPKLKYHLQQIHARVGFYWKYPVHETLTALEGVENNIAICNSIILMHYPDNKKPRPYIDLLELSTKENPNELQHSFWLMREYSWQNKIKEAIEEGHRFLTISGSVNISEYGAVLRLLGKLRAKSNNKEMAENCFLKACIADKTAESWSCLAEFYLSQNDHEGAYWASTKALKANKCNNYLCEEKAHKELPLDIGSVAAFYMGLKKKSKDMIKELLQLNPNVERYKNNYELIMKG